MTASYTEVGAYLDCRRRHFYSYIEGITPVSESIAMSDGSQGHEVLAAYYESRKRGESHTDAVNYARTTFDSLEYTFDPNGKRADLYDMLFNYYFPNEPYCSNGYDILAVEKEFLLRWDDGEDEGLKFVIDLIVRDKRGQIGIIDHKFTGSFTTEDMGQMLPQIPLYIAAIRAQGLPAHWGEYNEINMRKVQKKRTVNEALHRLPFLPTPERVAETFRQQVEVSRDIQGIKDAYEEFPEEVADSAWRSIDKIKCGMCSFQTLCVGELNGSNVAIIRETQFRKKESRKFA